MVYKIRYVNMGLANVFMAFLIKYFVHVTWLMVSCIGSSDIYICFDISKLPQDILQSNIGLYGVTEDKQNCHFDFPLI